MLPDLYFQIAQCACGTFRAGGLDIGKLYHRSRRRILYLLQYFFIHKKTVYVHHRIAGSSIYLEGVALNIVGVAVQRIRGKMP